MYLGLWYVGYAARLWPPGLAVAFGFTWPGLALFSAARPSNAGRSFAALVGLSIYAAGPVPFPLARGAPRLFRRVVTWLALGRSLRARGARAVGRSPRRRGKMLFLRNADRRLQFYRTIWSAGVLGRRARKLTWAEWWAVGRWSKHPFTPDRGITSEKYTKRNGQGDVAHLCAGEGGIKTSRRRRFENHKGATFGSQKCQQN